MHTCLPGPMLTLGCVWEKLKVGVNIHGHRKQKCAHLNTKYTDLVYRLPVGVKELLYKIAVK